MLLSAGDFEGREKSGAGETEVIFGKYIVPYALDPWFE